MPDKVQFQLLECEIMLAGDPLNSVVRGRHNPVTYPEMLTLRYLHGENSVTDIYDCGYLERTDAEENLRLCNLYGAEIIKTKMFPGIGLALPPGDNRYKQRVIPRKAAVLVEDTTLPDATVSPAVSMEPRTAPAVQSYSPAKAEPEAVPSEPETVDAAPAAAVDASLIAAANRRPTPVATS